MSLPTMEEELFAYREPAAIGVSFRRSGKVYYFSPNGLRVRQGDVVLAQTEKGIDIGEVVFVKYEVPELDEAKELKPLLRKATREDLDHEQALQLKEREARKACEAKIVEHDLPMRLIAADYTFDEQRLVFFFSSEGRVDFRGLVKDLAEMFRTRIELRQIGVRDQAKMIGGLGPCGRPLCCNAFLRNFDPVGIRVAKDQGLSLNPAKISGICDRLMCCLRYEHSTYAELSRQMPKVGQIVNTRKGPGEVKSVLLMHERLTVLLPGGEIANLKASEVWPPGEAMPEALAKQQAEELEHVPEVDEPTRPILDTPRVIMRRPKEGGGGSGRSGSRQAAQTRPAPPPKPAPVEAQEETSGEEEAGKSKRRRRRRGKGRKGEGQPQAAGGPTTGAAQAPTEKPASPPPPARTPAQPAGKPQAEAGEGSDAAKKTRRRRPRYRARKKPDTPTQSE